MKVELKAFQEAASRAVLDELAEARLSVAKGKLQAVVLSAPTGSGKTITVASVIDQMFGGGDGVQARPDTVFLWLSDSPELNVQSMGKLLGACDCLPYHRIVTIYSESFDQERLYPGHLYFINTQLLGKDKRLAQDGDKRKYTFWQTVANSVASSPENFVLIIDEAHRGATANDRNRTPIMQRFVLGSDVDGLPAVPLVLGMSATPQRFTELLGNTNRTQRPVVITSDDVRSSGLLKDLIIVHNPKTGTKSDITLLEHAAVRWSEFTKLWKNYCDKESEKQTVRPILVVQVEDGSEKILTRTNLPDVVGVIERQSGVLGLNEIVHCFQDQAEIQAGGRIIRKIEASRIQDDPEVKVVLFKTALNTGWDCPRAEVMMSFRRSQDATSIAQLVGRMIRTPLARRIETDEVLNTVELFLPHYDAKALEGVLSKLRNPGAEEGLPTRVETAAVAYPRNRRMGKVFDHLKTLPTYSVSRAPKMGDIKRVLRLAGLLVHGDVYADADEEIRQILTTKLREIRDSLVARDPSWNASVRSGGEIDVDVTLVSIGEMDVSGRKTIKLTLSEENIDQLFDASGRILAAGEGLHRSYWKRYHDHEIPNEAKLELFALASRQSVLAEMQKLAQSEFERLWKAHKPGIQDLNPARRARFSALIQASGKPSLMSWELPEKIVESQKGDIWKDHLYCDTEESFQSDLNDWEKQFLKEAMKDADFVGWLRNLPRREWAFCVPYELGGTKAFYPDFLIVRQKGKGFEVDVLEPHDDSRSDTWAKAKGLAVFADEHGMEFGHLRIGRKKAKLIQVVDMNDPATREKARKMQSQSDLESLFS